MGFGCFTGSISVLATRAAWGWAVVGAGLAGALALLDWGWDWDREGAAIIPTLLSQKESLPGAVAAGLA
jgi:hypothetical protein